MPGKGTFNSAVLDAARASKLWHIQNQCVTCCDIHAQVDAQVGGHRGMIRPTCDMVNRSLIRTISGYVEPKRKFKATGPLASQFQGRLLFSFEARDDPMYPGSCPMFRD